MKKKFFALVLCLMMCVSVFAGCSLIERNDRKYFEAVVCTISYVDGTKEEITKRELIMAYNSYGYNYVQNYGYTKEKAVNTTLDTIVDKRLTIKAVNEHYKKLNEGLLETDVNFQPVLNGRETTYVWDNTYASVRDNLKSYFNEIAGIKEGEQSETEAEKSVYTPYAKAAYLQEKDGKLVIKKTTTATTIRDTYELRVENGAVYDFENDYFKEVMYNKLISLTEGNSTGAKTWKSALNKYLADVKENYSYKKFATDKECFMFELDRVYNILKDNYLVEKYTAIYNSEAHQDADTANVAVNDVLKYYSSKVRAGYTNYCINGNSSAFQSSILSEPEKVDYIMEGDNATDYFYTGYVKIAMTQQQSNQLASIKADLNKTDKQKDKEIDELYASLQAKVRDAKTGKETEQRIGVEQLLQKIETDLDACLPYTGDAATDKQLGYDRAEAFRKYLYLYNDDNTIKGAERNLVFGVSSTGEVLSKSDYSEKTDILDAIKALYNGGNAKVGDITNLVRADDGLYIFFYAGKVENPFVGIDEKFDASTRQDNIKTLASTRLNIFSEKTIFDSIYETLTTDNFSVFQNMDMKNLKENLVDNDGVVAIKNNIKDLYK